MSELAMLSVEELQSLIAEAKQQIVERQKTDIKKAYLQVVEIASSVGMSVEDLLKAGRGASGKAQSKNTVAPKYANPDNPSETWTGRGKQPKWISAKQASGVALESLRIQN